MTICKPYTEETASDFRQLFVERFPGGDTRILDMMLANPVRREHPSAGSIAFEEDGKVKAILGLVPRVIYCGSQRQLASNGVAIAVRKDADRAFFPDFIRNAVNGNGAGLFFVNTAIPPSRKRVKEVLGVLDGPESCSEIRERAVRSNGRLVRLIRKIGKFLGLDRSAARLESSPYHAEIGGLFFAREMLIDAQDFDSFWDRYLKTNEGLVSSRTAEELQWMFGRGLATGEVVLLSARKEGVLQGYAFLRRTDESATCWRVVDLIACGNDETTLTSLIEGASRFLRQCTPAFCLQITGYPMWVQPLLKRLFPTSSSFGFNKCVWAFLSEKAKSLCGDWMNAPNGWYGCPYDGDMCLV